MDLVVGQVAHSPSRLSWRPLSFRRARRLFTAKCLVSGILVPNLIVRSDRPRDFARRPAVVLHVPFKNSLHFEFTDRVNGHLHTFLWAICNFSKVFLRLAKP